MIFVERGNHAQSKRSLKTLDMLRQQGWLKTTGVENL